MSSEIMQSHPPASLLCHSKLNLSCISRELSTSAMMLQAPSLPFTHNNHLTWLGTQLRTSEMMFLLPPPPMPLSHDNTLKRLESSAFSLSSARQRIDHVMHPPTSAVMLPLLSLRLPKDMTKLERLQRELEHVQSARIKLLEAFQSKQLNPLRQHHQHEQHQPQQLQEPPLHQRVCQKANYLPTHHKRNPAFFEKHLASLQHDRDDEGNTALPPKKRVRCPVSRTTLSTGAQQATIATVREHAVKRQVS